MNLYEIEQELRRALAALEEAMRQRHPEDTHRAITRAVVALQSAKRKLAEEEVQP